jgi:hypothetical protein
MFFLEWLIIGQVAKIVEHGTHFDTLAHLLGQQVEKGIGYGVVSEIEILKMNAVFCLADILEHAQEFITTAFQQSHPVVVGQRHTRFFQIVHHRFGTVHFNGVGRIVS